MVIKALVDLYEKLLEQKLVAPEGWDKQKISYKIVLNPKGEIENIVDIRDKVTRGKKTVLIPQMITMPKGVIRSGNIKANFLWDNSSYMFGYNPKDPERGQKTFKAMAKKHHQILDNCESDTAKAILAFFDTFTTDQLEQPTLKIMMKDIIDKPFNYTFCLKGKDIPDMTENKEIQKAWQHYIETQEKSEDDVYATCSITGKPNQKIAVLHPKIKGIAGGDASGTSLICYNTKSVCSNGQEGQQGINAWVSEYAAAGYAKALNWLLSSPHHHMLIGDVTVVYWSKDNNEIYGNCFETAMGTNNFNKEKEEKDPLHSIIENIKKGQDSFFDYDNEILDGNKSFFVLGLGSSGARANIRFFMEDNFGHILENIYRHQLRIEIQRPENITELTLWQLLLRTVRTKDDIKSRDLDALFNSILYNRPYPASLYFNTLQRIFLETDKGEGINKTIKIGYTRAGIIKAYLLQNYGDKWEELNTVALNPDCNNKNYLCGRLFAILEGIQYQAKPDLNKNLKDRFFNSACRNPKIIFPLILKIANSHLKKLPPKLQLYMQKKENELLDRITVNQTEGFPANLTPEEKGVFILGYYQQKQEAYKLAAQRKAEKAAYEAEHPKSSDEKKKKDKKKKAKTKRKE